MPTVETPGSGKPGTPAESRTLADAFKGLPAEVVRKAWLQGQMLAARDLAMRAGAPTQQQQQPKARPPRR